MRRVALLGAIALALLAGGARAAGELTLTVVSQNSSTITLGWTPQPGYGYLFSTQASASAPLVLVSRTNDAGRSTVKFAKTYAYEVAVIVKGASGSYPPPSSGDTTAPSVALTAPTNGSTVSGVITVTATASDNVGVTKVEFFRDGSVFATDTTAPYSVPFDTTSVANGAHTFAARAYDAANNATSGAAVAVTVSNTVSTSCDLNANTATFASQVNAAAAGQTVCLASGNYGTWAGTSKAITVKAASGATPQMRVSFGSGDSGFTLDGMTGMGGSVNGATNVTIRNSSFTASLDADGANANVVLDGNKFNWNTQGTTGQNSKLGIGGGNRTLASPALIIRNNEFRNGDLDGIFVGGGSGYLIQNNVFANLCDAGQNHTDNLQFADVSPAVTQTRVVGNFVQSPPGNTCYSQGITSYDHGTNGVIIENNVVDVSRPWGIELYSDVNSIVRHNTVVYRPASQCVFNTTCGKITLDHKSGDPVGTGTQIYDNLAVVELDGASSGTQHHNVSSQTAVYVGPLTFHDGYLLAASSPVGKGAASDGTDIGVYATG